MSLDGTTDDEYHEQLEYEYNVIFSLCTCAYKTSILFLYLRLFSDNKRMRYAIWAVMSIVVGYYVILIALAICVCMPPRKFWDEDIDGKCLDVRALAGSTCIMNIITDLLIFALPWHMVTRLNMTWRRKAQLLFVFSTGSLYDGPSTQSSIGSPLTSSAASAS